MKIHSLSKVLIIPLGLCVLAVWFFVPDALTYKLFLMILPLAGLAVMYVLGGEIDHWWQKKYPLGIDEIGKRWLQMYSPFYNGLTESEKQKYENRLGVYINAREFKQRKGKENIELIPDLKLAIAHQAITLTFYREDYLIGDFDRIYCYGHPFPSPEIKTLHTVEVQKNDGLMILLDAQHAMVGIVNPEQHYNIAMHAYVDAFLSVNKVILPEISIYDLQNIVKLSGYSIEQIVEVVGHNLYEPDVVLITLYFTYPEKFAETYPELNKEYESIFKKVGLN